VSSITEQEQLSEDSFVITHAVKDVQTRQILWRVRSLLLTETNENPKEIEYGLSVHGALFAQDRHHITGPANALMN
jgi:hypothetical protein